MTDSEYVHEDAHLHQARPLKSPTVTVTESVPRPPSVIFWHSAKNAEPMRFSDDEDYRSVTVLLTRDGVATYKGYLTYSDSHMGDYIPPCWWRLDPDEDGDDNATMLSNEEQPQLWCYLDSTGQPEYLSRVETAVSPAGNIVYLHHGTVRSRREIATDLQIKGTVAPRMYRAEFDDRLKDKVVPLESRRTAKAGSLRIQHYTIFAAMRAFVDIVQKDYPDLSNMEIDAVVSNAESWQALKGDVAQLLQALKINV